MKSNAEIVTEMLLSAALRTQQLALVLSNAAAEGRDVTDAEVEMAATGFEAADAVLATKIEAAKGG